MIGLSTADDVFNFRAEVDGLDKRGEGRSFATASWTADENKAVGMVYEFF